MASLLDIIKQNQQKQSALPGTTAGIQPQAGLMQNLAAQSGKANLQGTGTGPKMSSISQQLANQQTGQQLGQVKQQEQMAGLDTQQDQAQQQQQVQQQTNQLNLRQQGLTQDYNNKLSSLTQDLEQNRSKMGQEEYQQKLQEAYQAAALSNKKYISDLNQAGAKLRLNNASNFKLSSAQAAADSLMGQTLKEQEYERIFNSNARSFAEMMNNFTIDEARKIYNNKTQDANTRMIIEGAGGAGAAYAGSSGSKSGAGK